MNEGLSKILLKMINDLDSSDVIVISKNKKGNIIIQEKKQLK